MFARFAAILLLVLGMCAVTARAEDPATVRRAVEDALSGEGFQRALPRDAETPLAESPEDDPGSGSGWGRGRSGSGSAAAPAAAGFLAQVFAWLLIAAAAVMILYFVVRLVLGARSARTARAAGASLVSASPQAPTPRGPLPTLDEALALAERGKYDEAAHLLLVAALGRVLGTVPPDALTSREILGQAPLETDVRQELGRLVRAVEASLFAGRRLERPEFDGCVKSYRVLCGTGEAAS